MSWISVSQLAGDVWVMLDVGDDEELNIFFKWC